jgi:ABC-type multidrug transport system fused ATPase/permease subunit
MDAEAFFSKRHDEMLLRLMGVKVRQSLNLELLNALTGMPTQVVLACLYGLIVYQAVGHASGIAPGVFITIIGCTPQLMQPFKSFAMLSVVASASWPSVQLITQLLAEESRIKDLPGAREIRGVEPTLEARHVRFGYAPDRPKVFEDLNFRLPAAGITGFVARMGQGKTTFFRLALRFYDPESGEVLLGGHPTTSFTLQSLRRCAVLMSQFPAFFHDTVRENFRLGRPDATDAEIRALCQKTGLWAKLEEAVGPDPLDRQFAAGANLSGGYKKLFALTRCLLRNPTFLFLDEPTTNMSNDEKYVLIPLMREACKGKTVVVVDHDLSWLTQFCDHIVVLDAGKIVQEGTASELLAVPGVLNELYSLAHPA